MRVLEMLAEFISKVLRLIEKGDVGKAENLLENAYSDFMKEEAAFFTRIPTEELTTKLLQEHNYTNGHLEILAELFFIEAELKMKQERLSVAKEFYTKSLYLTEYVVKESGTFSFAKQKKIDNLRSKVEELSEVK